MQTVIISAACKKVVFYEHEEYFNEFNKFVTSSMWRLFIVLLSRPVYARVIRMPLSRKSNDDEVMDTV